MVLPTKQMELRHKETWSGSWRDVPFEVCHWNMHIPDGMPPLTVPMRSDVWNYYLMLHKDEVAESYRDQFFLKPKRVKWHESSPWRHDYKYYDSAWATLDWHGGLTYYDRITGRELLDVAKAGCDYNHGFDQTAYYDLDFVLAEVRRTIDDLHEQYGKALTLIKK